MRRALYRASLSTRRYHSVIKAFYLRLFDEGQPPKLVLVAWMHKLFSILDALPQIRTPMVGGILSPLTKIGWRTIPATSGFRGRCDSANASAA